MNVIEMRRYHRDVHLPNLPKATLKLVYSNHARNAASDDRYLDLTPHLPSTLTVETANVVELDVAVTTLGKRITKILFRHTLGNGYDLCLVAAALPSGSWLVKTVWANETTDHHRTLRNREQFAVSY